MSLTTDVKKQRDAMMKRVNFMRVNLPEFWPQENLREIEVLCRTIGELDSVLVANADGRYKSAAPFVTEHKEWLRRHGRGSSIKTPDAEIERMAAEAKIENRK